MSDALDESVAQVLAAVHAGQNDALPKAAGRLVRHASGTGARLERAGHTHQTDHAAAVQVAWKRDEMYRDALWLLFQHDGDWSCVGHATEDAVAQWFLKHPSDGVPTFEALPADEDLEALGHTLIAMATGQAERPSEGAVAALTAPVDDDAWVLTLGAVRALPDAGRGMLELAWVEADDPEWTEESRWAVARRGETGWQVEAMVYLGSMASLLDGVDLSWPDATG